MFEKSTQIRVRYAETDQMGVVYHGNFAQYFEVGRAESIRQLGYTYKDMEVDGLLMPVVDLQMKFVSPIVYDEMITVKTKIQEIPTGHKVTFHQEVYSEAGKLACVGQITLYFLDHKTRAKTTPPQKLIEIIAGYFH